MNRKILVCGASGRLGTLVAEALRDRQADAPRVLVRPARIDDGWQTPPGMELAAGDFTDSASLDAALDGVKSVFLVSPVHPDMRQRELALAEAAARCPSPPHIVKVSGLATRLDSPVDSGRWHAEIEQGIRRLNLPATFLRPNFFFQNLAFQAQGMRRDGILRGAVGDAAIAMVDTRDIADVAATVLVTDGLSNGPLAADESVVSLTADRTYSYEAVAGIFSSAFGTPVHYQRQSRRSVENALLAAGQPAWHIRILLQFNDAFQLDEGSEATDSVARILKRPARTLEAYARELVEGATAAGRDPFPS